MLCDKEISLDEVRSEGLRQWNMDMDVAYQHETFNGLPVYYGGDMYDSEDSGITILYIWHVRRMWRNIILMFRREWN